LIGAADGAATALSTILYRDPVYVGVERLSAIAFWAGGAATVGIIVGGLLGVSIYYGIFAGRVSVRDAVCLATGDFAIELSWVATPLIVIIGSFALVGRRATATPTGGRS
jgi:hypothetical protein